LLVTWVCIQHSGEADDLILNPKPSKPFNPQSFNQKNVPLSLTRIKGCACEKTSFLGLKYRRGGQLLITLIHRWRRSMVEEKSFTMGYEMAITGIPAPQAIEVG